MKTKHDLSYNKAVINLDEIHTALVMGFVELREACNRLAQQLYNRGENAFRDYHYQAQYLAEMATKLDQVATSLHYIDEAKNRDEIVIEK